MSKTERDEIETGLRGVVDWLLSSRLVGHEMRAVQAAEMVKSAIDHLRAHNSDSAEPHLWGLMFPDNMRVDAHNVFLTKGAAILKAMDMQIKPAVVPLYLASPPEKEVEITDEMVELAARSIYETDDVWSTAMPFDTIPDFDKGTYRTFARAALTAALTNGTPDDEVGNG